MVWIAIILGLVGLIALIWALVCERKLAWAGPTVMVVAAIFFLFSCFTVIPAGHVGVLTFFGKVYGTVGEGMHLVNPLAGVTKMTVRTQEMFEHASVPSSEGLDVMFEVSILYHLLPTMADKVYQTAGSDYGKILVQPQFRSAIRDATVKFEAKDLYTAGREKIVSAIFTDLEKPLSDRGIVIEKVLPRRIELPKTVADAINAKQAADQDAQRMRFVLEKERQEAERKRIEAQGIQDFQKIVSQGIDERLLRWKGIEATEKLATSPNAKMVIVGGKDGLPLILNSGQ